MDESREIAAVVEYGSTKKFFIDKDDYSYVFIFGLYFIHDSQDEGRIELRYEIKSMSAVAVKVRVEITAHDLTKFRESILEGRPNISISIDDAYLEDIDKSCGAEPSITRLRIPLTGPMNVSEVIHEFYNHYFTEKASEATAQEFSVNSIGPKSVN